ncbi:MAG: hypothetical protein ACK5PQ_05175 [Alphaproteobacteria bacterium]
MTEWSWECQDEGAGMRLGLGIRWIALWHPWFSLCHREHKTHPCHPRGSWGRNMGGYVPKSPWGTLSCGFNAYDYGPIKKPKISEKS